MDGSSRELSVPINRNSALTFVYRSREIFRQNEIQWHVEIYHRTACRGEARLFNSSKSRLRSTVYVLVIVRRCSRSSNSLTRRFQTSPVDICLDCDTMTLLTTAGTASKSFCHSPSAHNAYRANYYSAEQPPRSLQSVNEAN